MKLSFFSKSIALIVVAFATMGEAASGEEKASVPTNLSGLDDAETSASGLPMSSEGVPSVASLPVEEPAVSPVNAPQAGDDVQSEGSHGDGPDMAPFDAGEWFDDELPEYFQPVEAEDLDFDLWFMVYRDSLRPMIISGKDRTRTAFMQLVRMIDDDRIRDALLTDLVGWACRRRHHRALQSLKVELQQAYEEFIATYTSRGMSLEAAKSLWPSLQQQLTLDWKAAIKVTETEFREKARRGAEQVTGVPVGAVATMLGRRRRRRQRKARRNQGKAGKRTDGEGDNSDTDTSDDDDSDHGEEDQDGDEDGGGKMRARP